MFFEWNHFLTLSLFYQANQIFDSKVAESLNKAAQLDQDSSVQHHHRPSPNFQPDVAMSSKPINEIHEQSGQTADFNNDSSPTLVPTVSPSYSPTASLIPTSNSVKYFSQVGQGYCQDQSNEFYSFITSTGLPARTTDTYCINWCLQNPHPDLVGVEIEHYDNDVYCVCDFSGGLPLDINLSDYHPDADWYDNYDGVGAIFTTDGDPGIVCYRYDVSDLLPYFSKLSNLVS